ncbi:50S ribosomal protein L9 [Agrococcus terreus]|uniref:Large ribosomal subunit protein bL9 n=1 Tax=Agrococcus terreus TaxID=574649 RepID=A0ABQ2KC40_9MICO|nr:50S ribosomal protein L9 [Agrococcus terreus]GGN77252.1 50S ribosomal protein L9 [Agrococcus terreus]
MAKLILTNEVSGLGSAGDVVEVKNGFARNYLVPQGLAVAWSRGGEKQVEQIKAARAAREHATIEEAQDLRQRLEANAVVLSAKAGAEGRLFGSIQTKDIAEAVEAAGHGSIDRRVIEIPTPIRATGEHTATARLRDDIIATITLKVVAAK